MTCRSTPAGPPPDLLAAFAPVAQAYRRQFCQGVWIWNANPACLPALAAAMRAAMQADQPLTCEEAAAITGVSPPPLDGDE
jgi:hypothetical protein